ncbi:kininogen-1-like isoform X2 [Erinaceus europaeus]|uniref:Kininogen-1-like isoform X2 n=1 Tax=Erinaceus europaeus TaxID=9365 RepID=A0A1S2ZID1_ERIEU|nr:kininogen-1-like isoform X2 [Erinaceus europaeus]
MKLIAFLFFCSRVVLSLTQEFLSQEVDCDDPDLFTAVDAALKKYNERIQTGNHFVLYRITEATKTDENNPFYTFKYQIKEGDCSVQSGKSWQDCDYKDSAAAATGECTATVGERNLKKFLVATQTCQITPAEGPVTTAQYNCRGCRHPISTSDPDLEPVLRHSVQYFNSQSKHSHLFTLKEVKSAHRQVVAGWNYDVIYSIEQTNCSKENFPSLTSDCQPFLNGDFGECTDQAYVNISLSVVNFSQKCDIFQAEDVVKPPPKLCYGCPKEIPVDSPELKEALTHSIRHLNAENNGTFYFKIDAVTKATKQLVAGIKYSVTFTARETICSKDHDIEMIETCNNKNLGQILACEADIIIVSFENKVFPTVHCHPLSLTSMKKRPPGFSPFRAAVMMETTEGKTRQLKSCEYRGRAHKSGPEPTPASEVS